MTALVLAELVLTAAWWALALGGLATLGVWIARAVLGSDEA